MCSGASGVRLTGVTLMAAAAATAQDVLTSSTTTLPTPGPPVEPQLEWNPATDGVDVPKVITIVAVMLGAIIIGFLVAKLVEYYNERNSLRDNASDMSEYTRELLRAQLMMLTFSKAKKKGKKLKPEDYAIKYYKMWRAKVTRNKARRIKTSKEAAAAAGEGSKGSSPAKTGQVSPMKASPAKVNTVNETKTGASKPQAATTPVVVPKASVNKASLGSRPVSAGLRQARNK